MTRRPVKCYPNPFLFSLLRYGKHRPPYTIGRFPALSLADAAEAGRQVLRQLLQGVDPGQARNEHRAAPTFAVVAELFLLRYASDKADSGRRDREILERDFLPTWGDEKAQDIRRRDVIAALDRVAERGPVAANRAHSCIRKLFNWAIQRDLLETNPATNIPRSKEKMPVPEAFVYSKMLRSMAEVMSLVEIEARLRILEGETAQPAIAPRVAGSLGPMMKLAQSSKS